MEKVVLSKELGLRTVKLRPDVGDEYWFLNTVGDPIKGIYEMNVDVNVWGAGNGFFTKAEAIKESNRRKAERLIKDYKLEFDDVELDWYNVEQGKFYAQYFCVNNSIVASNTIQTIQNIIYFTNHIFITDSEKISGGKITKQVWLDYLGVSDERN